MTETEWLSCTDPRTMLVFLRTWQKEAGRKIPGRKLLLFEAACWRRYLHLDESALAATEAAELIADSGQQFTGREFLKALKGAEAAVGFIAGRSLNARKAERGIQAGLLRDIFGNPFQTYITDPAWLRWSDGTVRKMAQSVYDNRCFETLPIMADALEEAGCTNANMLAHCREGMLHVRGCWVVDCLLKKE